MNCKRWKLYFIVACLWGSLLPGSGFMTGAAFTSTALAATQPPAADPEIASLLRGVEQKYNRLKTLRLKFQETYQQAQQVLREEKGTLYLKNPGQMRWEYENPEPKLFLTDGHRVMLYVPEEKRLTQTQLKDSDDLRSPLRFLLGGLKFDKEFQKIEKARDVAPIESGDLVIRAVPKQMQDRLESVIMEISPGYEIRRLILVEPGGVRTDFRFTGQTDDPRLAPDLFRFQPPAGTEIVQE